MGLRNVLPTTSARRVVNYSDDPFRDELEQEGHANDDPSQHKCFDKPYFELMITNLRRVKHGPTFK